MTTHKQKFPPKSSSRRSGRCTYLTSDGRRCRMLRWEKHAHLCLFHAREELQLLESQRLGAELAASLTGQFMTATDVNFVLGKLFTALAQNRIPRRNAATLAYIGQLMLHSLRDVKNEYPFTYEFESWNNMLDEATPLSHSSPDSSADSSHENPSSAPEDS